MSSGTITPAAVSLKFFLVDNPRTQIVEWFEDLSAKARGLCVQWDPTGAITLIAPVVRSGGAKVEGPFAMSCPRLPLFSGVVDDDELSWRVDGVGGKVVRGTVQAVPGGDRGI